MRGLSHLLAAVRYRQVGDSFCTNSTPSTGTEASSDLAAGVARGARTSPEISTRVPTNGESWLSRACSRYVSLAAPAAAADVPVSGGTTFTRFAFTRTNRASLGLFGSAAAAERPPVCVRARSTQPV